MCLEKSFQEVNVQLQLLLAHGTLIASTKLEMTKATNTERKLK